jgi:geranyl-CoA carboxylase alpha subunit
VQALQDTSALGIATNRAFLIECLGHPEFAVGKASTQFIPRHFAKVAARAPGDAELALAAALWFERSASQHGHDSAGTWSSSAPIAWPLKLEVGATPLTRTVTVLGPRRYGVEGGDAPCELQIVATGDGSARFRLDGLEQSGNYTFAEDRLHLKFGALDFAVRETLYAPISASTAARGSDTEVRAPMNGKVVAVLVTEGETVAKGQRLVVVEAMKMQHEMTAGAVGKVVRLAVKPGDQVATRQLLIELKPAGDDPRAPHATVADET